MKKFAKKCKKVAKGGCNPFAGMLLYIQRMKPTDNGERAGGDESGNGNREGKTHHKPERTLTTEQQPGEGFGG